MKSAAEVHLENAKRAVKPMEETFDAQELFDKLDWFPKLEEGKCGDFRIVRDIIPAGEDITVISMRNALMMGYRPLVAVLPHELEVWKLLEKKRLLMSDSFQERFMMKDAIEAARGKVLVGGLGLGYVTSKIAEKPNVTSVTTVEIQQEIIDLVWSRIKTKKMRLVNGDLWKYLRCCKEKFDFIYLDIWYGTGEHEWTTNVLPLKRLAWRVKRRGGRVMSWAEETMETQVEATLYNLMNIPPDEPWLDSIPVYKCFRTRANGDVDKAVRAFLTNVGSRAWENRWGKHLDACIRQSGRSGG